ncbi:hypothetical protein B0H17DRAFT_1158026 [Mycena rosella]|uniref:Phospholipid/glycerol acyltransferase domain-containing protein n=1 Tax=Mycena rosella TaxID=1033263 RepID=A0AAD7GPV7_MYCRO|nr:hypothetical protein B0H17DRAFT_1158026 [Mycena rosella]
MEKFSAFRDPGTGVQPFLPLVPPPLDLLAKFSVPLALLVGVVRTALVLLLLAVHLILVGGLCVIFIPVPPVHRLVTHVLTAITARLALLTLGIFWISIDNVTRKRGRGAKDIETWNPRAGDLIVSNWVSWIEILWLAFRFNPIFVLPATETAPSPAVPATSKAISHTPGRRTGTGSANIGAASRAPTVRIPIVGFRQVSLLSALQFTGRAPPFGSGSYQSLEEIRRHAGRPVVIFPECTTSNGRALLHFADVFKEKVPVRAYNVFVMCVRYDPPTRFAATLAHTIPTSLNPLSHVFSVATSLAPQAVSIRLLAPSESPSSQLFLASEVLTGSNQADPLADACAALIAQIGKTKRTGMGWEDKLSFLDLFHTKKKR